MKSLYLSSLFCIFLSGQALACSEAGSRDFKISRDAESACSKIAQKYAVEFAKTMIGVEAQEKGYEGPRNDFNEHRTSSLYTTKIRIGNSKLIGFNVGLNTKDMWECNFCVQMSFDEKNNCRIESIQKHMCAK